PHPPSCSSPTPLSAVVCKGTVRPCEAGQGPARHGCQWHKRRRDRFGGPAFHIFVALLGVKCTSGAGTRVPPLAVMNKIGIGDGQQQEISMVGVATMIIGLMSLIVMWHSCESSPSRPTIREMSDL